MGTTDSWRTLNRTILTLENWSVPVFNLVKHAIFVYFVGHLAQLAYTALIETKRYLSLKAEGSFEIAPWGSSRNNVFSGSTFEGFLKMLRRNPSHKMSEKRMRSVLRVLRELFVVAIVLVFATCEAMSEFFTDSAVVTDVQFATRNITERYLSSWILHDTIGHSDESDRLFVRRCTSYDDGMTMVTRPNLVIEGGRFYAGERGRIPIYNYSHMCAYNHKDKSARILFNRSAIPRSGDDKFHYPPQEWRGHDETATLKHNIYLFEVVANVSLPHFVDEKYRSRNDTYEGELRNFAENTPFLATVRLDGELYTCTKSNVWCVRPDSGGYKVVFPSYDTTPEMNFDELFFGRAVERMGGFHALLPIWIDAKSVPNLVRDRHMARPQRLGNSDFHLVETLNMIAMGYNFGWSYQNQTTGRAIVNVSNRTVPTIKLGLIVFQPILILIAVALIIYNTTLRYMRRLGPLMGEGAILGYWALDKLGTNERTELIARERKEGQSRWILDIAVRDHHKRGIEEESQGDVESLPYEEVRREEISD